MLLTDAMMTMLMVLMMLMMTMMMVLKIETKHVRKVKQKYPSYMFLTIYTTQFLDTIFCPLNDTCEN